MILPTLKFEVDLWKQGYKLVVGLDEAGRGPLAGPMLAAAVIFGSKVFCRDVACNVSPTATLTNSKLPPFIRDSKSLSKNQRYGAYKWIYDHAYAIGIGRVENTEIDQVGLTQAEQLAFNRALNNLRLLPLPNPKSWTNHCGRSNLSEENVEPDYYLIDAFNLREVEVSKQQGIVKGDQKVFTIAAASIIAKVTRDEIMQDYHKQYPKYGFDKHVGYGTKRHIDAISKFGPCSLHRLSFKPISTFKIPDPGN